MRKLLFLLPFFSLLATAVFAQGEKPMPRMPDLKRNRDSLPYKRDPKFPAFIILHRDSVKVFDSKDIKPGKPVALMAFSPDCKHCKHAMQVLTEGMDSIKNIRFYLMTPSHRMPDIRKFYDDYNLGRYKNIKIVGADYDFFFITHYGSMSIPDIALYDGDLNFLHLFEGDAVTVKGLYEATHKEK